ncbi:MAG TPA: ankyrin repeat domain-containing protein, partial [Verrucomicrobiae bacterium]
MFGLLLLPAAAATDDLTSLLQKGLFEEEANRNLSAAITNYESLAKQFEQNRQIAATAVFRLGECYRKLGQTNEAAVQYQRILRDFSDQPTLVTLSRQNLAGMGKAIFSKNAANGKNEETSTTEEANALAAKLNSLKKFEKEDPEKYAQATLTVFPDEQLRRMLDNLPSLREQEARLKENPKANIPGLLIAYSGTGIEDNDVAKTPENATAQIEKQIRYIAGRANSIVSNQKIRLEVLQSVAKASGENGNAELAAADDPEDHEIRRIQAMIRNSPDLINSPSFEGGVATTPLRRAAWYGQSRVVNFLLDHGANVNLSADGKTALREAVRSGNKTMVELLLNRGADVNAIDSAGGTPLHLSVELGFRSVAEVLLAHHADINARNSEPNGERTPLHLAIARNRIEMLKLLIQAGANVNARAKGGMTPLMEALYDKQFDMIEPLLAAKADPNLATDDGITSLSLAAQLKNLEVVRQLLDAGAKPDAGDLNPPLFWAIKYADTNLAEVLLEAGADPNKPAKIDKKILGPNFAVITNLPLEFALWDSPPDKTEIVKLLLRFKANPNASDSTGQPLIFSGLYDPENLKALLEAGSDPNTTQTIPSGIGILGETP